MSWIAYGLRTAGQWPVDALMALGQTAGIVLISVLTGIGIMVAFKYTANSRALRAAKDTIQGALLGIVVFRHDTRAMFGEEGRLLRGSFRYMLAGIKPLAVVIIPMVAIFAAIELYAGYAPLPVGSSALVTVEAPGEDLGALDEATLAGNAVEVETEPLRIPATGEVCWRIRADEPGEHTLTLSTGGRSVEKSVVVGQDLRPIPISLHRVQSGFEHVLIRNDEPLIPGDAPVAAITVDYPEALVDLGFVRMHWIWATLIIATIAAIIVKPILKVEI
jgi:hypothetical protein